MWVLITFIFCFVLFLLYCGYKGWFFPVPWTKPKKGKIKVACVGDSITYGCMVENWYINQYPVVLQKKLGSKYDVRNCGMSARTGTKSGDHPYCKERIYRLSLEFEPDIVVIMFGTNDSKVENWKGAEQFREEYREFLTSYASLNSNPAMYIVTPPHGFYRDGNSSGPLRFNIQLPKIREIRESILLLADELNANVIDLFSMTADKNDWFGKDGVHPNATGARAIAQIVFEAICVTEEGKKHDQASI